MAHSTSPSLNATQQSPLAFVLCSSCRQPFDPASLDPAEAFFLTTCSHTICARCSFPTSACPPPDLQGLVVECPVADCRQQGPVLQLVEGGEMEGLGHCFRPVKSLLDEASMAIAWQMDNLAEQLVFFRNKCGQQKQTLGKLGAELKKMKALKSQVEQLTAENASLRSQLKEATQEQIQSRATSEAGRKLDGGSFHADDGSFGDGGLGTRKRRAGASPDRRSNPTPRSAPQNSHAASAFPHNLPLQPARLSLDPSHARSHSARQHQANLQRSNSTSLLQRSSSTTANLPRSNSTMPGSTGGSGRDSRAAANGRGGGGFDDRSPRERLADFTYDPSKTKAQIQTQQFSRSPSQQQQRAFVAPGRPPSTRSYLPIALQQPQQHEDSYSNLYQQRENDSDDAFYDLPSQQQRHFLPPPTPSHRSTPQPSQSEQRSPFIPLGPPPRTGVTPMPVPNRFQAAPNNQHYPPPTTVSQRQPFQSRQAQQQQFDSRGGAGTPRPGGGFAYRDPGGSSSAGGSNGFMRGGGLR